jgi:hypothetical protein
VITSAYSNGCFSRRRRSLLPRSCNIIILLPRRFISPGEDFLKLFCNWACVLSAIRNRRFFLLLIQRTFRDDISQQRQAATIKL